MSSDAPKAAAPAAEAPDGRISLVSKQNEEFFISKKASRQSIMLTKMIVSCCYTDDQLENARMPVPADSEELGRMIEWCEHHKEQPAATEESSTKEQVETTPWDAKFLNIANDELHKLICVADFFDVVRLNRLMCRIVAGWIKGKSPEMMRVAFGIPNEEEKAEMANGPFRARRNRDNN